MIKCHCSQNRLTHVIIYISRQTYLNQIPCGVVTKGSIAFITQTRLVNASNLLLRSSYFSGSACCDRLEGKEDAAIVLTTVTFQTRQWPACYRMKVRLCRHYSFDLSTPLSSLIAKYRPWSTSEIQCHWGGFDNKSRPEVCLHNNAWSLRPTVYAIIINYNVCMCSLRKKQDQP